MISLLSNHLLRYDYLVEEFDHFFYEAVFLVEFEEFCVADLACGNYYF